MKVVAGADITNLDKAKIDSNSITTKNLFSPSERQLVIEQLRELPAELTQQLAMASTDQNSCILITQDEDVELPKSVKEERV